MPETTTRKRGPESPEARIARADRVAQEMTIEERNLLLTLLSADPDVLDPEDLCTKELAEATARRDMAIQSAKDTFDAAKERNRRRSAVAAIYAGLSPEDRARLVRMIRAMDAE